MNNEVLEAGPAQGRDEFVDHGPLVVGAVTLVPDDGVDHRQEDEAPDEGGEDESQLGRPIFKKTREKILTVFQF